MRSPLFAARARAVATVCFCLLPVSCAHVEQAPAPPRIGAATPRPLRMSPTWNVADRHALIRDVEELLPQSEFGNHGGIVIEDAAGTRLYARRADRPAAPASTLKILVASTALEMLGPKFRLETSFTSLDGPQDGVIDGDVWLVGGGDPVLSTDDLRAGVGALYRAGVRRITGSVVVDASAFAGPEHNPLWSVEDRGYTYAAGTSSVSLDEGTVKFRITPGVPGGPAAVTIGPGTREVTLSSSILTVPAGYGNSVQMVPQSGSLSNRFVLQGQVAVGAPFEFDYPVPDNASYAGSVVDGLLAERKIETGSRAKLGVAPLAARTLWLHRSPPLSELLRTMLVHSDNHIAEQLLRVVGAQTGGRGTEASGVQEERAFLGRIGVPVRGMHAVDGSGLAPVNRVPPALLAGVLSAMDQSALASTFEHALPLVGEEGTVRYHDLHSAAGRVRAKSGHIDGVDALAGYVTTRRHGRLAFVVVANEAPASDSAIEDSEDQVLDRLADF